MPNMSKQYQLILGTFIDNEFVWHDVDSYDTIEEAYKEFKKYVNEQLKYTDEELMKVWNSGRLDIELRRGNRLLNWVGIYAREVDKLSEEEEEKADEDKPEKKKTEDSVSEKSFSIHVFKPDRKLATDIDVVSDSENGKFKWRLDHKIGPFKSEKDALDKFDELKANATNADEEFKLNIIGEKPRWFFATAPLKDELFARLFEIHEEEK